MKKAIVLGLLLALCPLAMADTYYSWRYREHATDCTALTDGKIRDLCYEIDADTFYKCEPTAGDCSGAEWRPMNTTGLAGTATALAADPTDCSAGQAPVGINASGVAQSCTTYLQSEVDGSTTNEIQNLFETFNASSGTDPVADSATDTLAVTGGTGITVTGDSTTDTLTIATTVVDTDTNANTICAGTTTYLDGEGNCDDISAVYQPLEATLTDIADGTIAEDLVNTANPWADNEVADTITASSYLPLSGGTLTGELKIDETGIEGQPTDALTDCSTFAATGGGIFYDDSEGQWKKCEDNTLTDLDTGGAITGTDTHVTFFDGANSPAGDAGFTYNKTTDSATLAGNVTVATEAYDATGWNADLTVPTKDAVRDKIETLSAGSGSTAMNLPIYSAKLTGAFTVFTPPTADACTQGAQIDAGDGNWRLLFDATTDECATWQFVVPDNYSSTPSLKIKYSMVSATANEVEFEGAIMCVTPGDAADIGTASFSNVAVASDTVPGTAGYLDTATITLTDDSCAAGDIAFVVISKDADDATNDDATGDTEIVGIEFDYA